MQIELTENEKQMADNIIKNAQILGCIKCAMWDEAAKPYGKRGMCAECYEKKYSGIENGMAKTD